ncbi:MAG TPA: UvrD-helicase domain-containing protein [Oscillospiraceae bacterium]|nr:UvrD-helicase domain-containing protein [Oscillospiraceae bacterium]
MDNDFEKRYVEARQNYIAAQFSSLNGMQRAAVMATEGPLLILAGAGSGKTTVLINRIANLMRFGRASDTDELPAGVTETDLAALEAGGADAARLAALDAVEPWRILAITFTNKAADELKNRLSAMLGSDAQDIWASTFHACCVRILRRDAEKLGFPSGFSIYDSADSQSLVKQILRELNYDDKMFPPRAVLSEISRAKDAQVGAEEYQKRAEKTGDIRLRHIAAVYSEYMRRMFTAGAMDFDDLISFTVKLLQEHDDVLGYWQKKFRYIMIDEYQDTNNLQYLLSSLLAGGWGNICVVGDDDQSIYKFRGATIENILSFEDEYKRCRTIRLEQNYRSTGAILDAANAVIQNNTARKGKNLWTQKPRGAPITLYTANDQNDEARFVSLRIKSACQEGSASFGDFAVLYRMNAQSKNLEDAFRQYDIPYRVIGGTRFYDRAEVKDMLAWLCVIAAPADDLRLMRVIGNTAKGIGDRTVETARELAASHEKSLFDILSHAGEYPELQRSATRLRLFTILIGELRAFAAENTPDALYDQLLEKTGYLVELEAKNTVEDTTRAENVRELKSSILGYMQSTGDRTLEGFLADVALYTDIDNYDRSADGVVLMTMHAAKGLEFPTVFVVGAEEGIFPGLRAIGEPEEMEEERRLCYVAITRAREKLYLTCARQRMLFGHTTNNKLSRFAEEIPEEYLIREESRLAASYGGGARASAVGYNTAYASRVRDAAPPGPRITPPPASAAANSGALPAFALGDAVEHKAFGHGVITAMRPMGNDSLIEIEFEGVGTKKLMLRAAALYMTKA